MKMSTQEWYLFFAGAEAFHTFIHTMFYFSNTLPVNFFSFTLTPSLNTVAIVVNAFITLLLLRGAKKI